MELPDFSSTFVLSIDQLSTQHHTRRSGFSDAIITYNIKSRSYSATKGNRKRNNIKRLNLNVDHLLTGMVVCYITDLSRTDT